MKLTVLGCSGSVPGPNSPASGYLVQADGFTLLVDLGNGAFGALQRHVNPADVDAIVISHLHSDHCVDLTAYVVALRYGGPGFRLPEDAPPVPLVGVPGTRDRVEAAYDPLARKLGLHELFKFDTPAAGELGPFRMSYAPVKHPTPTHAIRIEHGGRSLVYSGDTGECDDLVDLANGADAFLCEASVGPDEELIPDLHLTGAQAGQHAMRAGVGRLIVTHVPPWNSVEVAAAEAATTFDGPVELAAPDRVFEI